MTTIEQQKFQILGAAECEGLTETMRKYHAELIILHNVAKQSGERDQAAFLMAAGLFGLEIQEEYGL